MSTPLDKQRAKMKAERQKYDEEEIRLNNEIKTLQVERDSTAKRVTTLQRYQKPYMEVKSVIDPKLLISKHCIVHSKRVVWARLQRAPILVRHPFMQPTKATLLRDVQPVTRAANGTAPRSARARLPPSTHRHALRAAPRRSQSTTRLNYGDMGSARFDGAQLLLRDGGGEKQRMRRGSSQQSMNTSFSLSNTAPLDTYRFVVSMPLP